MLLMKESHLEPQSWLLQCTQQAQTSTAAASAQRLWTSFASVPMHCRQNLDAETWGMLGETWEMLNLLQASCSHMHQHHQPLTGQWE